MRPVKVGIMRHDARSNAEQQVSPAERIDACIYREDAYFRANKDPGVDHGKDQHGNEGTSYFAADIGRRSLPALDLVFREALFPKKPVRMNNEGGGNEINGQVDGERYQPDR